MEQGQLVRTTMTHLKDWSSIKRLKSCPLCGTLNVLENRECFSCRWSGEFDHDARLIRLRLAEIALVQPRLRELWMVEARPTVWQKLRRKLRGFGRRKVDYHA